MSSKAMMMVGVMAFLIAALIVVALPSNSPWLFLAAVPIFGWIFWAYTVVKKRQK